MSPIKSFDCQSSKYTVRSLRKTLLICFQHCSISEKITNKSEALRYLPEWMGH